MKFPPQSLHTHDASWRALSESERERVRQWFKSMGGDPDVTQSYVVEGDQLRVWEFHRVDGKLHTAHECPTQDHPDTGEFRPRICLIEKVI